MPTNCRITTESYSALTTAAKSKSAACALLPPAAAPSQAGDNAAPPAHTTRATAPPAPSLPEIPLAASSSCTAQSRSSSPESSVSSLRHSNLPVVEGRELNQSLPRRQRTMLLAISGIVALLAHATCLRLLPAASQ